MSFTILERYMQRTVMLVDCGDMATETITWLNEAIAVSSSIIMVQEDTRRNKKYCSADTRKGYDHLPDPHQVGRYLLVKGGPVAARLCQPISTHSSRREITLSAIPFSS